MSSAVLQELSQVLGKIDRPGSFCVSGSVPAVLPGLEVAGLGPIGLPLTDKQAEELKKLCEQAPYGKGEETLVDPSVRRVWQLKPERFTLRNPDWEEFLQQTVQKVQQELGLEEQQLESHLYDLLLYEPGSFFLPHRDGEKLERMVATLVIVLPSSFQGGELVVRHDGQEQTIDFSSANNQFRIHFAAFYADCEHEVRPLREGYRLCLVYNLTLKKGEKSISAPRSSEYVEPISQLLRDWAKDDAARRLVITFDHQYTQDGLTWDALKGADRLKARVLLEAVQQADCQAYLALLTFHESGSAEYAGGYSGRRSRWNDDDDDAGNYEMGEVFDSSLTADHWIDREGKQLLLGEISVEEDELLDPEALQAVDPEEEFEGYTGNAGMTLDRWYRHAAIILWPNKKQFDIFCDAGSQAAVQALGQMVSQWQRSGQENAAALQAQCGAFAATIMARWKENPYARSYPQPTTSCPLLPSLAALDEPKLIQAYLSQVLIKDAAIDPGKLLPQVLQEHGWETFQRELELVFQSTTAETLERNVRLLEQICLAEPRKQAGWIELCGALAQATLLALERIDEEKATHDYRARRVERAELLAGLARALLATEQFELLSRVVTHTLDRPEKYPLTLAHVAALTKLQPWLEKQIQKPCPALSSWIASCCEQLESLTEEFPQPPADFRRTAGLSCQCLDCGELRRFLEDPQEREHRFRVKEERRQHLQGIIQQQSCDLDLKTEKRGTPYTLVCTKNAASYQARLAKFHQDQAHLATLRALQASLPK
jgi:hypothetical protein